MADLDTPEIFDDFGSIEEFEQDAAMRAALGRITQATSEVIIDLHAKGAFYQYLRSRREIAVAALVELVATNPTDAGAIYELQAAIRPYLDGCEFIRQSIAAGRNADETIEELYGNGKEPSQE